MGHFQRASLRKKLISIIMLSCGIVLLLASATFVTTEVFFFRQSLLDKTASLAGILATNASLPLLFRDSQTAEEIIDSLASEPHIRQAFIFDGNNKPFVQYLRDDQDVEMYEDGAPHQTCAALAPALLKDGSDYCFSLHHLAFFQPIYLENRKIGTVFIQSDLDALYDRLARYGGGVVLVITIFAGLVYFLASGLQRLISAPILHLAEKMRHLSRHQDFSVRAEKQTDDEVGRLIEGFNEMLAQLESRDRQLEEYQHSLEAKVARRTEQLDEAKKAAEAASEAKSRFLATMSHEIRTPMSGLLGMTELLVQAELGDRHHALALTAHKSGEALLEVLNDILDFSKIEAGKLVLENKPFDLLEIVERSAELFGQKAFAKGLELYTVIAPEVPATVVGDAARLRQVLLNLTGNAVKFTERGEVCLRVELEERTEAAARLRFEVSDTGIGLSDEAQAHIFDSFSQADESTTRHYGGSGLGLAIVRELVELMGSRVELTSQPKVGSTFGFSLCLELPPESAPLRPKLAGDASAREVFLLVASAGYAGGIEAHLGRAGLPVEMVDDVESLGRRLAEVGQKEAAATVVADSLYWPQLRQRCIREGVGALSSRTAFVLLCPDPEGALCGEDPSVVASLRKPVPLAALFQALDQAAAPVSDASAQEVRERDRAGRPAVRRGRILLAEDNRDVQQLMRIHLEKQGFEVETVADGREAVARLERERFNLVFMDYNMPEMDGPEATRIVRGRGDDTPIVALTAHSRKETRDHFLESGVDDYLCKPFKQKQLVALLEKWFSPSAATSD